MMLTLYHCIFVRTGVKQPKFTEVCPKTVQCLNEIEDLLFSTTPFSFAFFSTLQPGASIKVSSNLCVYDFMKDLNC